MISLTKPSKLFLITLASASLLHLAIIFAPFTGGFSSFNPAPLTKPSAKPTSLKISFAPHLKEKPAPFIEAQPETSPPANKQPATPNLTSTTSSKGNLADRALTRLANLNALAASSNHIKRLSPNSQLTAEEKLYLDAWQAKVERVGRMNYPAEVAQQNLSGKLRMAVLINADGSLAKVELIKTSGSALLDETALNILHLAAPFAPLPTALQEEAKQLEIIRNWQIGQGLSAN